MESATRCGMELARSAVWNHHEVMYGINPKENARVPRDAMPSLCDGFHTTRKRVNAIPILRIG